LVLYHHYFINGALLSGGQISESIDNACVEATCLDKCGLALPDYIQVPFKINPIVESGLSKRNDTRFLLIISKRNKNGKSK
jgi:hypothetical protein